VAAYSYDAFKELLNKLRFREAAYFAQKAAIAYSRDRAFWLNQQSVALLRYGRPAEALVTAEEAQKLQPGYFSLLLCAEALLLTGDFETALAAYRKLGSVPTVADKAQRGTLDCLIKLYRLDEALLALADFYKTGEMLFSYKARILHGLDRVTETLDVCNQWIGVSPANRAAWWRVCTLEVMRDGLATTLTKYEALAASAPRQAIYRELCAILHLKSTFTTPDIKSPTIGSPPPPAGTMPKQAFVLAKSGKENEALPLFEELLRTDPADQYISNAYTAASRRVGYLENARQFYRALQLLFPEEKSMYCRMDAIARDLLRNREPL